ncbi:putative orfan [Tupanvirus soda lake]|uniref:Orfan n=2 Tax=Tupanvirus TaxID=2094720 RepID=A0AC62ADN1_9VIRU|nr:putative orfan [Tupanvirus soda lake]QKU35743.1 putative orfan [Tupanvirus soda lake]
MEKDTKNFVYYFEIKNCLVVTYRGTKRVVGTIVKCNYPESVEGCEYFINMEKCVNIHKKDSHWFLQTNFAIWKILDTTNIAPNLDQFLKNHDAYQKPIVELSECVLHYKPMSYFLTGKIITTTHGKYPSGKKVRINMAKALLAIKLYGYWTVETSNTIWKVVKISSVKSSCYDICLDLDKNLEKSVVTRSYAVN